MKTLGFLDDLYNFKDSKREKISDYLVALNKGSSFEQEELPE